jgi:outer membrane receptor for ferrienterochelin and colicin
VIINGSFTDIEARRDFVAGKIIIGRKRIQESGLQNVEDLLKREPVITVGKDGRIGLLGLPGYTQILVDGMPPTTGKDINELDLVRREN